MTNGSGNVPIMESAAAGWRFLFSRFTALLPIFILLGGVYGVANYYYQYLNFSMALSTNPQEILSKMMYMSLLFIPMIMVPIWIYAALFRVALLDPPGGLFGIAIGKIELINLGQYLLMLVIVMVAGFAILFPVMFIIAIVLGVMAAAESSAVAIVVAILFFSLIFIAFLLMMYWAIARFMIAFPWTTVEKRFRLFDAWTLTKGQGVRILLANIVAYIPVLILNFLVIGLYVFPKVMGAIREAGGFEAFKEAAERSNNDPEAMNEFLLPLMQGMFTDISFVVLTVVMMLVGSTVMVGVSSYIFLGLYDNHQGRTVETPGQVSN